MMLKPSRVQKPGVYKTDIGLHRIQGITGPTLYEHMNLTQISDISDINYQYRKGTYSIYYRCFYIAILLYYDLL